MTAALDIGAGDIVRLRDGRTLGVDGIASSYHDATGEHEGPFITTRESRDFYPVTDVAEVVTRNPNRCDLCGGGVTSKDPERYPYCVSCHYTGAVAEHLRQEHLRPIREAFPDSEVEVWHTGGGCFMVAVAFADDEGYYGLTDGDAGLPSDEEGNPVPDGWGILVHYVDEEDCDGRVLLHENDITTERVVEAIRADR